MPLCEENGCKEGQFNLNGICYQCSIKVVNCNKCSYAAPSGSSNKVFKCLECVGGLNGEYRVINGICQTCQNKPGCQECSYVKGSLDDYTCNNCKNNYYPSNGKCYECSYKSRSITNGQCYDYYCPNGISSYKNYCNCNSNYILTNQNTCIPCPNGCRYNYCYYDNNANSAKCSSCDSGYALNSDNICISCGVGCSSCYLNGNDPQCTRCSYGYIKNNNNKCENVEIPANCNSYYNERFNNLNEAK